ncbi:glycoside hydrolase family 19 protein [Pseudomonas sp. Marseille-P9899]|uniref:glycoside hydrolase family 19 protein n=1 Tax=Pseudomonas sp. Marseille-P9899 TaxID=2730401 RepID=UPI001588C4C8|nr:hypothetical protein [Pseudomonas sp. Marseille-P9899]
MSGFLRGLAFWKRHKNKHPSVVAVAAPPAAVATPAPVTPPPLPASAPSPVVQHFSFNLALMKRMFSGVGDNRHGDLLAIAHELNAHLDFYKLDTPLRRSHFFAQILQETSDRLIVEESFAYRSSSLPKTFKYFRNNPDAACTHGFCKPGLVKANGERMARYDFEAIANFAYGARADLGNGGHASGDGWAFRGRGLKQLTGRHNYTRFQRWHENHQTRWPDDTVDFLKNPDLLLQMKYATRSAVNFWLENRLYEKADLGSAPEVVNRITDVVNKGTSEDSREKRRANFKRIWDGAMMKLA